MIRALFKLVFYPLLGTRLSKRPRAEYSDTAPPPAADPDRVHLFAGQFPSEIEVTDYCLKPLGRNKPEPLTRDLPDAMIDTSEIEIIFGETRLVAALPMFTPRPDIGPANTVVMVSEAAFGGLPYSLNDTPVLRYLGAFHVR